MAKVPVLLNSDRVEPGCPVLDGHARHEFRDAAKSANGFSAAVLGWLEAKDPKAQVAWLRTCVNLSRDLLQPWTIEVLFLLSVVGPIRFSRLQEMLRVSSRTLSDRLKFLIEKGLVERRVLDDFPVRIEYVPTKVGKKAASLAAPLMAHLGLQEMERSGRA